MRFSRDFLPWWLVHVMLGSLSPPAHALVESVNCNNSDWALVRFKKTGAVFPITRWCSWIGQNNNYCTHINLMTGAAVGLTCGKECPLVSGCGSLPTMSPTNTSPTPVPLLGPYPAGPYITPATANEMITMAYPPIPSDLNKTIQTNCPHQEPGLLDWHDAATWGVAGVPTSGKNVSVPAGKRLVIRQTVSPRLGFVTIPTGSELIFGQNASGIALNVSGIIVQGKLTMGSETCRLNQAIVVTLHGARPLNAVTSPKGPEYKGISVAGGILSLHGKRYFPTWTRLAKTVNSNDTAIVLQDQVNWKPRQQVVIVTSALKDSRDYNQNEVRTIAAVHPNPPAGAGAIVYLTAPVKYKHIANRQYQVEVGLLTRIIKIQGAHDDSEPTDPDPLNGSCMDTDGASLASGAIYQQTTMPCMNKELTGYGGHIIVHAGGVAQVEGVELYRMGQTNVLGRYPIHFHLLGKSPTNYFRYSSVHRSFYRCVVIHGTNQTNVTENVGFDVSGYCYYLEDGVEQDNMISFNLAALIHMIGAKIPRADGQYTEYSYQSSKLTNPADITAGGFYIPNVHNYFIGNAASGGYSGFVFPNLRSPLQSFRNSALRPLNVVGLAFDGNSAHSSGWWWSRVGTFYFGGSLFYDSSNSLVYNPGRPQGDDEYYNDSRCPCHFNQCADDPYLGCGFSCPDYQWAWFKMTNTKAFLSIGSGVISWSGRLELDGLEVHDTSLAMNAISEALWINRLLNVCRTGEPMDFPSPVGKAQSIQGSGFFWYDTAQTHIMTSSVFRNCGYRSDQYSQYDSDPARGCGDSPNTGCQGWSSTTFGLSTVADQFAPQIMQGTRNITFDRCGRRFRFTEDGDTVSSRGQNWLDIDGTISRFGVSSLIGSGAQGAKDWWQVEDDVGRDVQAPLVFIKKNNGPQRSMGYFYMYWDSSLHSQVGGSICTAGNGAPCPPEAFIRHLGHKFSPLQHPGSIGQGLPVTANPLVVGLTGGYGWLLTFNRTVPRSLTFYEFQIDPGSVLMLSIPYPVGTSFNITASAVSWCTADASYKCSETFAAVGSVAAVRAGMGNTYYFDPANGILTLRLISFGSAFVGNPNWFIPTYATPGRDGLGRAIPSYERGGVLVPKLPYGNSLTIQARCPSDTSSSPKEGYCSESVNKLYDPDVCASGFIQLAYDRCCLVSNMSKCEFANGSRNY